MIRLISMGRSIVFFRIILSIFIFCSHSEIAFGFDSVAVATKNTCSEIIQLVTLDVDFDLTKTAEKALGRSLSQVEAVALKRAHLYGIGKLGEDGNPAGLGNYTQGQKNVKALILSRVSKATDGKMGFTKREIEILGENGIIGVRGERGVQDYGPRISEAKTWQDARDLNSQSRTQAQMPGLSGAEQKFVRDAHAIATIEFARAARRLAGPHLSNKEYRELQDTAAMLEACVRKRR